VSNQTPRLAVVVPAFNEAATVLQSLERVLAQPFVKEVVVVNDASTDQTGELLASVGDSRVKVVTHEKNRGKGAALRTGFALASGPYVGVHDADLEYDPADFAKLLVPLDEGKADVVFGSRFISGEARRVLFYWHSVGNRLLTWLSNMATNTNMSDMETCYKVFRREILDQIVIEEDRFGFEPEITAKVAGLGARIYEVGISYSGRTYAEGKKISWRDGFRAIYCIAKYSGSSKKRQ
jgi:glycosyltransferase involved in cell wall biosynthesis